MSIHFNRPPLKFIYSNIYTNKKKFPKFLKNIRALVNFYSQHTLLEVLSEGKLKLLWPQ